MTTRTFRFPTIGAKADDRAVLLAIDDFSLPFKKNLCCYMSKPTVRPEPVLAPRRDQPDAPDYLGAHFYGTVLHEGDKFRMWYYSCSLGDQPGTLRAGPICYAESKDGIAWSRPNLGQVEFKGGRDNNAIDLPGVPTYGAHLIREDDDPDPQRRYKLVYEYVDVGSPKRLPTIRTATSADGLHWHAGPPLPIPDFLEQCTLYKYNGLYLIGGQSVSPYQRSEGGYALGRQGYVWVSPDFDRWIDAAAEAFFLPEPHNPADRGHDKPYDQVHVGVAPVNLGNVLVGLHCVWHNAPLPDHWFGYGQTSGDLGITVSNDGIHFREPVKGHVFIAKEDSPAQQIEGRPYPTILVQANGILNVGAETRIYHGRWRNARPGGDYYAEVGLATLPRDRWGALGLFPDATEGSLWSAPIRLPAGDTHVILNADAARDMRVEIADARFNLLPDYAGDNSGATPAQGGLDCAVTWPKGSLAVLADREVRLRIRVERQPAAEPRLYAVYLE